MCHKHAKAYGMPVQGVTAKLKAYGGEDKKVVLTAMAHGDELQDGRVYNGTDGQWWSPAKAQGKFVDLGTGIVFTGLKQCFEALAPDLIEPHATSAEPAFKAPFHRDVLLQLPMEDAVLNGECVVWKGISTFADEEDAEAICAQNYHQKTISHLKHPKEECIGECTASAAAAVAAAASSVLAPAAAVAPAAADTAATDGHEMQAEEERGLQWLMDPVEGHCFDGGLLGVVAALTMESSSLGGGGPRDEDDRK